MGYRSQMVFKTTTEGWIIFKKFNDSIKAKDEQPLAYMDIQKTESGFYKISHDDIKWYESYKDIQNFIKGMELLREQDIPYAFVRLGEDVEDIEVKKNYTDDMPDELESLEPVVDINDDDWGHYEDVVLEDKVKEVMFKLFSEYEEYDDIKDALRSLNSDGEVTDEQYDEYLDRWDTILAEWEEERRKK